jgi:RNA polymerase primary sigma factor
LIKKAPAGTATQIADERQSQLKLLIARGKEQGYLTYAEVNDHLPSEIVDPEQIEDIVNMINDMGIPGLEAVKIALGSYPGTYDLLLRHYETVKA